MLGVAFLVAQVVLLFLAKPKTELKGIWLPLLLSFPFFFYPISLFYSADFNEGYLYVERTLLLMILPWLLYFNKSTLTQGSVQKTMPFFSLVMALLSLYGIGSMFYQSTFTKAIASQDAYYVIRTHLENTTGLHPTYFSLLSALGFLSLVFELKKENLPFWKRVNRIVLLVILLAGLILASSKMILSALFIALMIILLQGLRPKAILVRLVVFLSIALFLILAIRPLNERVSSFMLAITETGVEQQNPDSLRKGIYKSSLEIIGENPFFGTGIGDAQKELNKKYKDNGYPLALKRNFNTHNQYLQLWLSVGIIPFLVFIVSLLIQFFIAYFNRNTLHLAFVVLFSMSFLTENILARQDGIFAYAFFSSFFLYSTWSLNKGRIFINGRYLSQNTTGVQRFATELARALIVLNPNTVVLSMERKESRAIRSLSIFSIPINGQIWEQMVLPAYLRLLGSPLLLNLGNSAPIFYRNSIICLHDLAFKIHPSWFSDRFQKWYHFMIPRIIKSSKHILTVSAFSKSEIGNHYNVPDHKISILYNGIPEYAQLSSTSAPLVDGNYALCVGTLSERKNQIKLIQAYLEIEDPPFKLVLAGSMNQQIFKDQAKILDQLKPSPNCILFEQPSDQELAQLYQHALFCIYIPIYEGFGIPILESLAFRKPILVSDIPVFRELFSEYVLFSSLSNIDNLRKELLEMFNKSELWQKKVQKFNFKDKEFTYQSSANKLTTLIKKQYEKEA